MKKVLFLLLLFSIVISVNAQIAKKESKVHTKSIDTLSPFFQINELPDRQSLKKLTESEFNFDLKKKVTIDTEKHWYALENISNEVYWNNVNCGEIIIEFQKNFALENSSVKEFLDRHSLSKVIESSMFPELQNFYVFEVVNGKKTKVLSIVRDAKEIDFIVNAEPVALISNKACPPNDPYYSQQWGPHVMYADSVWCYFTGGSKNWLAVIDDAVDWYHEDLYDAVWYGYDFAMNDTDPTPDNGQAHGTHVTGTVAATTNNGFGVAGMIVDTIYFAKVKDNTSIYFSNTAIANALNSIASNSKIRVVNMSFGSSAQNSVIETALQNAYNNGKLLIGAAGNDATSDPMYPASYAIVINVSAVGVDNFGDLTNASYSNYGSTIDVSAPGGSSPGYQIISTLPSNNYGSMQGTSMAAPHVAGVAGLVFAVNPLLTNIQARSIIEQQVFDLGTSGWDPFFGSGMVCAWCAFEEACNQLSISISAASSTNFCSGGSVNLNAINNNGLSYQWQKDGIDIPGATSYSYTASQTGSYSLKIETIGGVCVAYSNSIPVLVGSLPANAGSISGTTSVCQGQNSVTYSVPPITNATSYIWTLPSGVNGSSSTNSINVNFSISAISGNVIVKGANTCGQGAMSNLSITVIPKPPVPIISINGNELYSDATNGNQWYLNGNLIPGATEQNHTVQENGNYHVVVSNAYNCSSQSNSIYLTTVGISELKIFGITSIYPNPSADYLNIKFSEHQNEMIFEIVDNAGRVHEYIAVNSIDQNNVVTLGLLNLANGVYNLKISSGNKQLNYKVVITK
jgi:hypothetical protein